MQLLSTGDHVEDVEIGELVALGASVTWITAAETVFIVRDVYIYAGLKYVRIGRFVYLLVCWRSLKV